MSLRKRGKVWYIEFCAPNGKRVRQSSQTESKSQAKELHDRLKAEFWRIQKAGLQEMDFQRRGYSRQLSRRH